MCISAAIVAGATLLMSAVQTVSSITAANNNTKLETYKNAVEAKQLREKASIERLAAIEQENTRSEDFARIRSTALAAIGASGLSENISYFQGIDPHSQDAFLRDIRNIRLNLVAQQSDIRDQIQVGAYGLRISKANASLSKVSAIAAFAKDAINAATFYGNNKAPAAKAPASGG